MDDTGSSPSVRHVVVCEDVDPFDAVVTPLSLVSRRPRPPATSHTHALPQASHVAPDRPTLPGQRPAEGSSGLDLARRLRVAATSGASPGGASPHSAAPARPPAAAPATKARNNLATVSPPAKQPTDAKSLMQLMQANAATAPDGKTAKAPARTRFTGGKAPVGASVPPPGPRIDASSRLLPCADLPAAVRSGVPTGPPPPIVAVGMLTTSGDSNFSPQLSLPDHPRTADTNVSLLVAAFNGEVYSFGKGRDACEKFVAMLADTNFTADIITFNAPALLSVLVASAMASERHLQLDPRRFGDVRLLGWLLRPDQRAEGFDDFVSLHAETAPGIPRTVTAPGSPDGVIARLHMLQHLMRPLQRVLAQRGTLVAYMAVERPLMLTLATMKCRGFRVDLNVVQAASSEATRVMDAAREKALQLVPSGVEFGGSTGASGFNIQSPEHCRKILYDVLQLHRKLDPEDASAHTTGTGKVSTSEETLKLLTGFHPLPGVILEYRKVAKLRQTYFDGLFGRAVPGPDGGPARVHATFLQDGTDTGRLSCADPNLQNLPRCATEMLGAVRAAFVPDADGDVLLALDYEQIELRVLAHMSGDETLRGALTSGDAQQRDIHRRIAAKIFRKNFEAVTAAERTAAKRVVFGVIYGMGPKALAAQLERPVEEARTIMSDFKRGFPSVERYIATTQDACRRDGEVRTILDRCRPLPEIRDSNPARRAMAERQAFNTVIQGSAADIVKKAMVKVSALLRDDVETFKGVTLLSQIHDELVFSCPHATHRDVAMRLRSAMEECMTLAVPLVVKPQVGLNLADMTDVA